jgi:hypothetical protein
MGFINRLQVATTVTYNTVPDLHNLQSLHYNLLSIFPLVFTIRFLATDFSTGIITDSYFKYHCNKSLLITINTALPLFLHFMVQTHTHTSPLLVTQLKTQELALQITPNITHDESLPPTRKSSQADLLFSSVLLVPICCVVHVLLLCLLFTLNWTKTVTSFTSPHLELNWTGYYQSRII